MEVILAPLSNQQEDKIKPVKPEIAIFTPAYPEYNSSERVKKINLEIIVRKIQ